MRRILAFALSALLACVVATARTEESKRPVKTRPTTTHMESKKSKPKNSSKPKASNSSTAQALLYTPNVLDFSANGGSFQMVEVRGGTFRMGGTSEQGSDASINEKPVHSVTLNSYYIGITEVTQALWTAVMGSDSNPSDYKGDNLPVENVSWEECQTFIEKLNALTGRSFRLPTEAEWEFACRGGNNSRGYKYSGSNDPNLVAWYEDNSSDRTHTVATKAPNELGIYDMCGNVYEWCADWYGDYSANAQTNPTGPTSGWCRVMRGGCFSYHAGYCRSSSRSFNDPSFHSGNLGLRLALSL